MEVRILIWFSTLLTICFYATHACLLDRLLPRHHDESNLQHFYNPQYFYPLHYTDQAQNPEYTQNIVQTAPVPLLEYPSVNYPVQSYYPSAFTTYPEELPRFPTAMQRLLSLIRLYRQGYYVPRYPIGESIAMPTDNLPLANSVPNVISSSMFLHPGILPSHIDSREIIRTHGNTIIREYYPSVMKQVEEFTPVPQTVDPTKEPTISTNSRIGAPEETEETAMNSSSVIPAEPRATPSVTAELNQTQELVIPAPTTIPIQEDVQDPIGPESVAETSENPDLSETVQADDDDVLSSEKTEDLVGDLTAKEHKTIEEEDESITKSKKLPNDDATVNYTKVGKDVDEFKKPSSFKNTLNKVYVDNPGDPRNRVVSKKYNTEEVHTTKKYSHVDNSPYY